MSSNNCSSEDSTPPQHSTTTKSPIRRRCRRWPRRFGLAIPNSCVCVCARAHAIRASSFPPFAGAVYGGGGMHLHASACAMRAEWHRRTETAATTNDVNVSSSFIYLYVREPVRISVRRRNVAAVVVVVPWDACSQLHARRAAAAQLSRSMPCISCRRIIKVWHFNPKCSRSYP